MHVWNTSCVADCVVTKTLKSPVKFCRRIDRLHGEDGYLPGKIDALGNAKAEETNRLAILLEIRGAVPQLLLPLTTQPGMMYDVLK